MINLLNKGSKSKKMSEGKVAQMDEVCSKCGGIKAKNNILLVCEYKHCLKSIHDNCNNNPVLIDGSSKFVCEDHRKNFEEEMANNLEKSKISKSPLNPDMTNQDDDEQIEEISSIQANGTTHVTKRKPSHRPVHYDCATCKDKEASTSTNVVTCLGCHKTFHLSCQQAFGELSVMNNIIMCHICNPLNYYKNDVNSIDDTVVSPPPSKNKLKQRRTIQPERSDYKKQNPNKNTKFPERNLNSKKIHFNSNDETNESETSTEGQKYRHSTPARNQHNSHKFQENSTHNKITNAAKNRNSVLPPAFEIDKSSSQKNNKSDMEKMMSPMIAFLQKTSLTQLPQVNENVLAWDSFYRTYLETRDFFSTCENLNRVIVALQNDEVKKIGGHSLYNMDNFEDALLNIDSRLKKKDSALLNRANHLRECKKPRDDDYQGQLDIMDKIIDFQNLIVTNNDKTYNYDHKFMLELIGKFPINMYNKWITMCADLKKKNKGLNFGNLAFLMRKELSHIELKRDDKKILEGITNENKKTITKPKLKNDTNEEMWLNHASENYDETSENQRLNYNSKEKLPLSPELVCWKHNNANHKYSKCKLLWELNGRTVKAMAQEANRCTICGMKKHDPCPAEIHLKCQTEGCNEKHHALYCEKRIGDRERRNGNQINLMHFAEELNHRNKEEEVSEDEQEEEYQHYMTTENYSPVNNHTELNEENNGNSNPLIVNKSDNVILGCLVVKLENNKPITLLIDSGSSISTIEESIADELGCKGPNVPLKIKWSGGQQRVDLNSRMVEIALSNMDNPNIKEIMHFRTDSKLMIGNQKFIAQEFYDKFPHLKNLKLHDYDKIDGILGINNFNLIANSKIIKNEENKQVIGVTTHLGDYVIAVKYSTKFIYDELMKNIKSKENLCKRPETKQPKSDKLENISYQSSKQNKEMIKEENLPNLNISKGKQTDNNFSKNWKKRLRRSNKTIDEPVPTTSFQQEKALLQRETDPFDLYVEYNY